MVTEYQGKYFTVRVIIPDRTPEEQAIRDKEIEDNLRAMYKRREYEINERRSNKS